MTRNCPGSGHLEIRKQVLWQPRRGTCLYSVTSWLWIYLCQTPAWSRSTYNSLLPLLFIPSHNRIPIGGSSLGYLWHRSVSKEFIKMVAKVLFLFIHQSVTSFTKYSRSECDSSLILHTLYYKVMSVTLLQLDSSKGHFTIQHQRFCTWFSAEASSNDSAGTAIEALQCHTHMKPLLKSLFQLYKQFAKWGYGL